MKTDLVFDIKPAAPSDLRALNDHVVNRTKDGTSAIDPDRSHMNQHLHGDPAGPSASLEAFYGPKDKPRVKRPAAQAEAPYLTVVIGASPEYFRPNDPEARGTFDPARTKAWRDRSLAWLKAEFGDDLVYADLHLDEDTPHIHAVIAPTYGKKPRKPGRKKKRETEEQFEARKLAAESAPVVRTVGRASHPTLSKPNSFQRLREGLTVALADLGIEYGEDRGSDAPDGMSTREFVAQENVRLRKEREELESRASLLAMREGLCERAERALDAREEQLNQREARLRAVYAKVQGMLGAVAKHLGVEHKLSAIAEVLRPHVVNDEPEPDQEADRDPFGLGQ